MSNAHSCGRPPETVPHGPTSTPAWPRHSSREVSVRSWSGWAQGSATLQEGARENGRRLGARSRRLLTGTHGCPEQDGAMLRCDSHGRSSVAVQGTHGKSGGWTGHSAATQRGQAWPGSTRSPSQALPLGTHGAGQGEGTPGQPPGEEPGATGRGQTPRPVGQATPGHRTGRGGGGPQLPHGSANPPHGRRQRPAGRGGSPGGAAGAAGIAGWRGRCPPAPGPGDAQLPRRGHGSAPPPPRALRRCRAAPVPGGPGARSGAGRGGREGPDRGAGLSPS